MIPAPSRQEEPAEVHMEDVPLSPLARDIVHAFTFEDGVPRLASARLASCINACRDSAHDDGARAAAAQELLAFALRLSDVDAAAAAEAIGTLVALAGLLLARGPAPGDDDSRADAARAIGAAWHGAPVARDGSGLSLLQALLADKTRR